MGWKPGWIFSVDPPTNLIASLVEWSSENITELIVTTNQISVFFNTSAIRIDCVNGELNFPRAFTEGGRV